jgi:hypothetical protein
MAIEGWQVPLWDAINRYVEACGGDPGKHVYGDTRRQTAVAEVDAVVRAAQDHTSIQAAHGKALLSEVLRGADILTDRKWMRAAKRLVEET